MTDAPPARRMRLKKSNPLGRGYHRVKSGNGFSYKDPDGRTVHDADLRQRFDALAIPPAWIDVWIAPYENGHIQAVGTDAAGRKQYRYHPTWRERKDRSKYARAMVLAEHLPTARRTVVKHLRDPDMSRRKVLAAAFRLLDHGGLRIGSGREEETGSRGLTSLVRTDAQVDGSDVHLTFPAKSHKTWDSVVHDRLLAAVIVDLQERPGDDPVLFAYEADGSWHHLSPQDVNKYVKKRLGERFTAKDFRTLRGTVEAAKSLAKHGPEPKRTAQKRAVAQAMRDAADALSNTPTIAKASYVDPRVVDRYRAGQTIDPERLRSAEAEVRELLYEDPDEPIERPGD